ncbi:MAG TPA: UDP-N-acetylglucosamine 2-epimerase (non-hydrolyzing) [Jiangellales bacterium]|nr:UDP-N-acetylglucosamine 2-epimerase (non-hydrolyzing) [Jiangellales bacterium]
MTRVMLVFGTRPEAIKMAPVVRALAASPHHEPVVVVTAQHREMLDQVLDLFGITPDHDLDVSSPRQGLGPLTSRAIDRLGPVLAAERPDLLLVQGDTTTTLVGALAGFYAQVPVVHLEAGLRTNDVLNPFPEEMNRRLVTRLAALHLAATPAARENLLSEGVSPADVHVTGNTVIDALLWAVHLDRPVEDPLLARAQRHDGPVLLWTSHRRESWGAPMARVGSAVARVAEAEPDLLVVLPAHRNPTVREALAPTVSGMPNVVVGEPADYWSFARLMRRATLLLTDSGGVQEEGPSLGKPVLVTRETTERPEAIDAGVAELVGTDPDLVVRRVRRLLHDPAAYARMATAVSPYGDGRAAARTVQAVERLLRGGPVEEFAPEPGSVHATESVVIGN